MTLATPSGRESASSEGIELTIVCSSPGGPAIGDPAEDSEYEFMAGTRGSDTDYTIYAWSKVPSATRPTPDDLFESVPANVLTELTEAESSSSSRATAREMTAPRDDRRVEGDASVASPQVSVSPIPGSISRWARP